MQSATRFCSMAIAAAGLLLMPVAHAQNQPPATAPTTPSPATAPANIPDSKLDAAAAAVKSVSTVKNTFEKKMAQAPAAERERLVGEANDAITKAVTDQGLSVDEFTTIMEVAENEPVVRDKLLRRLK